jgi:hypothetical protein
MIEAGRRSYVPREKKVETIYEICRLVSHLSTCRSIEME